MKLKITALAIVSTRELTGNEAAAFNIPWMNLKTVRNYCFIFVSSSTHSFTGLMPTMYLGT